jgi:hypothetical protein
LRSQEVKQTDKEIPSTRPCWIDGSEVWTHYLKPLVNAVIMGGWVLLSESKDKVDEF